MTPEQDEIPDLVKTVAWAICSTDGVDPDEPCTRSPGGAAALGWTWYVPHAREAIAAVIYELIDRGNLNTYIETDAR